jgi:hypothetical protein
LFVIRHILRDPSEDIMYFTRTIYLKGAHLHYI